MSHSHEDPNQVFLKKVAARINELWPPRGSPGRGYFAPPKPDGVGKIIEALENNKKYPSTYSKIQRIFIITEEKLKEHRGEKGYLKSNQGRFYYEFNLLSNGLLGHDENFNARRGSHHEEEKKEIPRPPRREAIINSDPVPPPGAAAPSAPADPNAPVVIHARAPAPPKPDEPNAENNYNEPHPGEQFKKSEKPKEENIPAPSPRSRRGSP